MILDAPNDRDCLGQLTTLARELAAGSAAARIAAQLGTCGRVVSWLQSLPQSDDDGRETLQAIQCDVAQRVRIFPADPNCFERTLAALALCEILDPKTPRCALTIARPVRHTSLVELRGAEWTPIDLFPRRNFADQWRAASAEVGKDILQGIHKFIGKPLLSAYGLGGVAEQIGDAEDRGLGRSKPPTEPAAASAASSQTPASSRPRQPPMQPQGENPDVTSTTEENRVSPVARVGFWPPSDRPRRVEE